MRTCARLEAACAPSTLILQEIAIYVLKPRQMTDPGLEGAGVAWNQKLDGGFEPARDEIEGVGGWRGGIESRFPKSVSTASDVA